MDRAGCDVHGNPIPKEDATKLLDKVSIVPQTVTVKVESSRAFSECPFSKCIVKVGSQVMLIKVRRQNVGYEDALNKSSIRTSFQAA